MRIRNEDRSPNKTEISELRDEDITVPECYRRELRGLLSRNREVIAMTDKELGQTETVEMRIDTGDHPPIKLRPYRTPIHKRKLVEEAVNEMMDSGIIERSKSPWSFPRGKERWRAQVLYGFSPAERNYKTASSASPPD